MSTVYIDGANHIGSHPPTEFQALAFSDTVDNNFTKVPIGHTSYARSFISDQAGDIVIVMWDNTTYTWTVEANKLYVGLFRRFNATGTTVTSGTMMS